MTRKELENVYVENGLKDYTKETKKRQLFQLTFLF